MADRLVNLLVDPPEVYTLRCDLDDWITTTTAPYNPICETFICPCCGTTYIANRAGFIPNCTNCGSTMKKEIK